MDNLKKKDGIKELADKLLVANKELVFQNEENEKQATELLVAKNEITIQEELIEMQNAFFIEKQLFEQTLLSIGDAVISTDKNKNILFLNKVLWDL